MPLGMGVSDQNIMIHNKRGNYSFLKNFPKILIRKLYFFIL